MAIEEDDIDKTIAEWSISFDDDRGSATAPPTAQTTLPIPQSNPASSLFSIFKRRSPVTPPPQVATTVAPEGEVAPELPVDDFSPADVFPSEMSCRQQFDELVKCHSVAGQARNIYRYGTIRDCNDRWDMFKFCMAVSMDEEPVRSKRIKQYYKEKVARDLAHGSSEDVWKIRTSRHPPLFDATDENDAQKG
ncbi:uncharacterized protein V1518DRAFT_410756 [Limtongia smithiae]|uniref:uncharacterized protein n=1 Tax=Limtongia smithiae TaxID=1125753 RepID=UPI0034CD7BE4